jgi:hypothetical protein
MPFHTGSASQFRPDIALALEEYDLLADAAGYIAHRLLPVFESPEQSAWFGRIPIEAMLRNPEVKRAAGGAYNRDDFELTDDYFTTHDYGHEGVKDRREAKIYAKWFDYEAIVADRQRGIVMRAAEIRAAAAIFNATTFTPHAVTNEWDDLTAATPIADVEAAVRRVWAATGLWPNALAINRMVFRNLRNCAQIIDRIESGGAGNATKPDDITAEMLARVFDLSEVIVGGSPKNTANEAAAVAVASIWSDEYAIVARVARTPDLREPCLGRTVHWGEDGSQIGGTFEDYPEDRVRGDIIRCRHDVVEKILYVEAADLLSNITT